METILIISLVRAVFWFIMFTWAFRDKRLLLSLGTGLSSINSVIFSLNTAQVALPAWVINTSAVLATPILACTMVGIYILILEASAVHEKKWRFWK